jgi:quercetin dioxygenase-like cupin family protein
LSNKLEQLKHGELTTAIAPGTKNTLEIKPGNLITFICMGGEGTVKINDEKWTGVQEGVYRIVKVNDPTNYTLEIEAYPKSQGKFWVLFLFAEI